eukprot:13876409-Ditylum_brightwellii.AAC.1
MGRGRGMMGVAHGRKLEMTFDMGHSAEDGAALDAIDDIVNHGIDHDLVLGMTDDMKCSTERVRLIGSAEMKRGVVNGVVLDSDHGLELRVESDVELGYKNGI